MRVKIKSYARNLTIYLFFLGMVRGSLHPFSLKALKYLKVCLSDSIPLNPKDALFRHNQCTGGTLQIVHYCIQYMYFPKFSANFELFQSQKDTKFGTIISVSDSRTGNSLKNPWNPQNFSISSSRKKQNFDHTHSFMTQDRWFDKI